MAKVKFNERDHVAFSEAAAAAGMTIEQWLAEAGRQYGRAKLIAGGQRAARIVPVPVDAGTAAALDAETDRTGLRDWAFAAMCVREALTRRPDDLTTLWTTVLAHVALNGSSARHRRYLQLTRLEAIVEDTVLLSAPDSFTRDVIESRLRPEIAAALTRYLHRPVQVAVTIAPETESRSDRRDVFAEARSILEDLARALAVRSAHV